MTYTIYHKCEAVAAVTGRAGIKAFMTSSGLRFVFAARDDGQQYNVKLTNNRCTLMGA